MADDSSVGFVLAMARALHTAGTTAQRLEEHLDLISRRLNLRHPQFFSTPTSIFASFGPDAAQQVHLLRVEPASVNLGRLSELDRVALDVIEGRCTPDSGLARLEAIVAAPPPYPGWMTMVAYALSSGAVARFLGGGMREVLASSLIGLLVGALEAGSDRIAGLARVVEPLSAFLAALAATAIARVAGPYATYTATLAGIIVLLPGLMLTNAVRELAARHLASGTARFFGALVSLLSLAFGVALGDRLGSALFGLIPSVAPVPLPPWTSGLAVVAAGLGFVVILKADVRDALLVVLSGAAAYTAGRIGARFVGFELGLFMAALMGGVGSALFSRWRNRPQVMVLVPGILMLVPGSIGFRSLSNLLDHDVINGVQTAFTMVLAATALSAGLLVAGLLTPSRSLSRL